MTLELLLTSFSTVLPSTETVAKHFNPSLPKLDLLNPIGYQVQNNSFAQSQQLQQLSNQIDNAPGLLSENAYVRAATVSQNAKQKELSYPSRMGEEEYVKTMYKYIYNALEKNGIDGKKWAPILVAHTSIESGLGNAFSRKNNNFGGIKGKGSGPILTKEYIEGKGYQTITDTFKKFDSIEAFADEYVKMLKNRFHAFDGDVKDYLTNLKENNYFTARLEDYKPMLDSRLNRINKYLN